MGPITALLPSECLSEVQKQFNNLGKNAKSWLLFEVFNRWP